DDDCAVAADAGRECVDAAGDRLEADLASGAGPAEGKLGGAVVEGAGDDGAVGAHAPSLVEPPGGEREHARGGGPAERAISGAAAGAHDDRAITADADSSGGGAPREDAEGHDSLIGGPAESAGSVGGVGGADDYGAVGADPVDRGGGAAGEEADAVERLGVR